MRRLRLTVVSHACVLPVNQHVYACLSEIGWDVTLVTPARWQHEYSPSAFASRPLPELEGRFIPLPVILRGRPQRHLYARLRMGPRPDFLLLEEETFSLPALEWGLAARARGIPFGVQAAENLNRPLPAVARWARRWTLRHADLVTARSPAAAALARKWGYRGEAVVVPHAVPDWSASTHRGGRTFTVGFAGRLVPEKGVRDLLAAMRAFRAPAKLLLAGDGPLRDEIQRTEIPGVEIEVRSGLSHDEMPDAYAEMDVLVLPSRTTERWAEQFGRVLVEALWCGVPIVGSDSGEIPWVISSTSGGRIFHEGDVHELAQVLGELRDDPDGRDDLAVRGRENAERLFSIEAAAGGLDAALRSVIGRGRPRTRSSDPRDEHSRRRVALVAHGIHDHGGMERAFAELVRAAARQYQVVVVAADLAPELRELVEWRRVPVPRRPIPLKFAVFYVLGGVQVARARADVTQSLGAIIPNRVDIAAVHHCHLGFRQKTGSWAPPGMPLVRRLNTALLRVLSVGAERWAYRSGRVRLLTAVSAGVGQELSMNFSGVRVEVIPNGVSFPSVGPTSDVRRTVRRELDIDTGAVMALFVGDWESKGLDVAIEAVALARARGADDLLLVAVGRGELRRFRAIATGAGVDGHVHLLSPRSDVARFFVAADLFLFPTIYEGFPLVALEALAAGLPLIATPVNGIRELFDGREPGVLVDRTPESIAAALAELANDAERRTQIGVVGRSIVARYTWERSVGRTVGLYREFLGEAQRSAVAA